jgi:PDZ domain-containing secreted protein
VVGQYEPGDRVTVYFLRAGEKESALVKLAAHPDDPERAYLGVSFETMPAMGFGSPHD